MFIDGLKLQPVAFIPDGSRQAKDRLDNLCQIVRSWIEKTDGDSELVLAMLDREVKIRPLNEAHTLHRTGEKNT